MTTTATATAVVAAVVVPKMQMQQVKCSAHNVVYILFHNVVYILLYARNAVEVDAHNEVPGINIVLAGIIRTMIYEYILYKEHVLPYLLRLPQHLVDRACSGSRTYCTYKYLHNKREGCSYYCLVLLHTVVCEVWYCVPGMAIDTSSGTGRRQPMVYYCC